MPIIQATNFILTSDVEVSSPVTLNNPLVGYDNLVTSTHVAASTTQDGFPVSYLTTPETYQYWKGNQMIGEQYITVMFDSVVQVDYVGIAAHNLGTSLHAVSIEVATDLDSNGDPDWVEVVSPRLLTDDSPILFRLAESIPLGVRVVLADGEADPIIGVLHIGSLLVLPRRIYVGHRPLPHNKTTDHLTGRSENGKFLGRIVRRQFTQGAIELSKIPPATWRPDLKPWVEHAETLPFFFAWRPATYPLEVAYCWAMSDGSLTNELSNGYVKMSMAIQGIVR